MLLELNSALGRKTNSPLLHRERKEGRKEGGQSKRGEKSPATNKQTRLRRST
jgi:hypothetical protein